MNPRIHACWLLSIALLTACRGGEGAPARNEDEVIVFAAASLRDAFTDLRKDFRPSNPGAKVTFNFAGTQELRAQIEHGAAADVFASADVRHMDELVRAKHVENVHVFAKNEPVVVVAARHAGDLQDFADLPRAERLIVGAEEVPIGRYTLGILENAERKLGHAWRARVEQNVVSRELNVRQVLAKVSLGEADAGIVYRSDVRAAQGDVRIVNIPADLNVSAEYPLAVLTHAPHPKSAKQWLALVLSPVGQRALTRAGFIAVSRDAGSD